MVLMMMLVAAGPATRPATRPATAPAEQRVHVFVSGVVQGVSFRAFTKRTADELGVKGWVRNLKDGRVEAVMQGKPEAMEKMMRAIRRGPRGARVDGVEVKEEGT